MIDFQFRRLSAKPGLKLGKRRFKKTRRNFFSSYFKE
jgi:hypothetical protein